MPPVWCCIPISAGPRSTRRPSGGWRRSPPGTRIWRSTWALAAAASAARTSSRPCVSSSARRPPTWSTTAPARRCWHSLPWPGAAQSLKEGSDVVLISGDKLLGGPQAGILLGRRELIERCRKHPLSRALRADRMLLAALEATLRLYRDGRADELPALQGLKTSPSELRQRATRAALLLQQKGIACSVVESEGQVGGGSLPLRKLEGAGVALEDAPAPLLAALRAGDPPVIALVRDGRVVLDVRCVSDVGELADAVAQAAVRATAQKDDKLALAAEGGPGPAHSTGDPLDLEV